MSRRSSVIAYLRSADRDPDSVHALVRQLTACEETASTHGLSISQVCVDFGVSGLTAERPGLYELFGIVARQKSVRHVITADPSRIARSRTVALGVEQWLNEYGCQLIYTSAHPERTGEASHSPTKEAAA